MATIDITPIAEALVTLAAVLISSFVIPWIKKKIGAEKMTEFLSWVDIAVAAAEQLFDHIDTATKKEYVTAFLKDKGFELDAQDMDNAIEAAVIRLHKELYGAVAIAPGKATEGADNE